MKATRDIKKPICPRCQYASPIRYGFALGRQRWLCGSCKYQFSVNRLMCKPLALKLEAVKRYETGMSSNRVAEALGLSPTTVLLYARLLSPSDGRIHHLEPRLSYLIPLETRRMLRVLRMELHCLEKEIARLGETC